MIIPPCQEKRSVPLSEEEKEIQAVGSGVLARRCKRWEGGILGWLCSFRALKGLRNELQTLTEENQSMFEAEAAWQRCLTSQVC